MKKIALITKDNVLRRELAGVLPSGFTISSGKSVAREKIIFLDIDTVRPGLIREISEKNFVVAVTRQNMTGPVMEAVTFGAYEVIQRPLSRDVVPGILQELHDLDAEVMSHMDIGGIPPIPTCAIVGDSSLIMDLCKKLARLSQVDAPVLITGETGTGKELIAESIAQLSSRFGKPFVVVNCAAVPENLLESELFGFEKGSFTGAVSAKEGLLKIADNGSVFFDEIGELPLSLQGKLLRFLQTQTFYPVGSTKEVQVDVRVISATNRDIAEMVREGHFREDLYHRICVTSLHVPPLREHKKDIHPLVSFFISRYKHTAPRKIEGITSEFLKRLIAYEWPGNIRELENTVRSALALSKTHYLSTQDLKGLGSHSVSAKHTTFQETLSSALLSYINNALERKDGHIYEKIMLEVDKSVLGHILSHTGDNQSEAARILGINRLTLRKKLRY